MHGAWCMVDANFRCRRQSDARLVDADDLRCTTSITANARRPRCLLSMPTHDARRRCRTSMHQRIRGITHYALYKFTYLLTYHARCTMHHRCITTTWRCRVHARGRRRCSRWCRHTILYNNVSTSRYFYFYSSTNAWSHEQYCTIRRMHEHCQHWHAATWCLAFILADRLAEVTWRARRQLPYFTELTRTAYIIQTAI